MNASEYSLQASSDRRTEKQTAWCLITYKLGWIAYCSLSLIPKGYPLFVLMSLMVCLQNWPLHNSFLSTFKLKELNRKTFRPAKPMNPGQRFAIEVTASQSSGSGRIIRGVAAVSEQKNWSWWSDGSKSNS